MKKPMPSWRQSLNVWDSAARGASWRVVFWQLGAIASWLIVAFAIGKSAQALLDHEALGEALWLGLLGAAMRAGCQWVADVEAAQAGRRIVAAARSDVLKAIAQNGSDVLRGESAGARASQILDRTASLAGWSTRWRPGMYVGVLGPALVLSYVAVQSWLAAALLAVSMLASPVFIWLTTAETIATAKTQQAAVDALSGAFQSRAAQAGLLKSFRAIDRETENLRVQAQELRHRTLAVLRIAFLSTAVLEFFASISIALVAVYVGFKLLGVFPFPTGESLTLAEGLTALVLAPEFFAPIRRLSTLHHDRADAAAAAQGLGDVLKIANAPRRLPALHRAPVIRFRNVTLAHRESKLAVVNVNFEAHPGEITLLTGRSGAGKTSCLLALLGHRTIAQGDVTLDEVSLATGASIAESAAYLRQAPWIMEGSLADNLRLARPDASDAQIEEALRKVGALHLIEGHSLGLNRPLARFGEGLSGGERQRLALARALLRNSPIWLLDEPTAHLDAFAEGTLLETLRGLAAGRTVLIASHRPALAAFADKVVSLQPCAEASA